MIDARDRRQTIFRRVRSQAGSFTIVNNDIVDDGALDLDELGALVRLLRKPGDWTMLPNALRKEFNVGRARFYRVMRKLRRLRYLHYAEQHGENGEFIAGVYSVYDAKIAPVSEIDLRGGSLPEEEAEPRADFRHAGGPHADNPHVELSTEPNQNPPYPPELAERPPEAGSEGPVLEEDADAPSRRVVLSGLPAPPSANLPKVGIPNFDEFWARWRPGPTESRNAAMRRWARLSDEARCSASAKIGAYNAACRESGQRRCHAKTYLGDRHFERFTESEGSAGIHEVPRGSRAAGLWAQHYAITGQRWRAEEMARCHRAGQPWFERTEFPPAGGSKGEG
jgi:hypothetical protein